MKKSTEINKDNIYKKTKLILSALTESPFWYRRPIKDRLEMVKERLAYFI